MELYFLKGEQAVLKRYKEKRQINENIFIKIIYLDKLKIKNMKEVLEEAFKDFNGLTHYEVIKFQKKKYLVIYYINKNSIKAIKTKEIKMSFPKNLISLFSNNIYLDLVEENNDYIFKFYLKGKLIYIASYREKNLYDHYISLIEDIKKNIKGKVNIIESKKDAFLIYSHKKEKLSYILSGGDKNIFKEKQKL